MTGPHRAARYCAGLLLCALFAVLGGCALRFLERGFDGVTVAEVAREAYPDPSAFDKRDPHYDPASKPDAPTWYVVDVRGVEKLPTYVTLAQMRTVKALEGMRLLQKGNRLSITPVTRKEWEVVRALGGLGKD